MFSRLLRRSLRHQLPKAAVAIVAVAAGASLLALGAAVSWGAGERMRDELRAYGANIVLLPKAAPAGTGPIGFGPVAGEGLIGEESLGAIEGAASCCLAGYAPYLYGVAEAGGQKVVLAGTRFDSIRKTSPWWSVEGGWAGDRDSGSAVVGAAVARRLGLRPGDALDVRHREHSRTFSVAGVVSTGGSEEQQVFVGLGAAQELLERGGGVSLVQVSVNPSIEPVERLAREIEAAVPGVEARTVWQVVRAEEEVLGKVQFMVGLVAALVLAAAALGVASTMAASVLERAPEIGLMRALGAGRREVSFLLLAEGAAIGAAGGLLGGVAGLAASQFAGTRLLQAPLPLQPAALLLALGASVGVALIATLAPLRRAVRIGPTAALRGE